MAKMTERMQAVFNKVSTVVLSTATTDGLPNAVPVGAKKMVDSETIIISDQFFNKTLANMKANPRVAVTFWDGQEGYQLKGVVTVETAGLLFEETVRWIDELSNKIGFPLKSKGVIKMKIEEIYSVSPGPAAGSKLA
jgi:uncharacterized protein